MLRDVRLETFVGGVARFVAARVPRDDAEDVAQDVLLRLHRGAADLREAAHAEAWVFSVARRAIADYYRARARRPEAEGADERIADLRRDPSVHEEVLSWLRPMADGLPDKYREALLLADFEGLPQREVARRLGLSLSGAKSRVQRARAMLGEMLRLCCEVELGPDGRAIEYVKRCGC